MESITPLTILSPLIALLIFILIIVLTIYNDRHLKIFELSLLLMLGSISFFIYSIQENVIPFTPTFQIIFLFIELIFFIRAWTKREK